MCKDCQDLDKSFFFFFFGQTVKTWSSIFNLTRNPFFSSSMTLSLVYVSVKDFVTSLSQDCPLDWDSPCLPVFFFLKKIYLFILSPQTPTLAQVGIEDVFRLSRKTSYTKPIKISVQMWVGGGPVEMDMLLLILTTIQSDFSIDLWSEVQNVP